MSAPAPKFVNLQTGAVQVYDEKGKRFNVVSYAQRDRKDWKDEVFVVEGEHYRQFVSKAGPLYPFPVPSAPVGKVPGKPNQAATPNASTPPATAPVVPVPVAPVDPGSSVVGAESGAADVEPVGAVAPAAPAPTEKRGGKKAK
jgi:hypothetical protein